MIGELGVGEETGSSSCSEFPAAVGSCASGLGDLLLRVRQEERRGAAALSAYLCFISSAK